MGYIDKKILKINSLAVGRERTEEANPKMLQEITLSALLAKDIHSLQPTFEMIIWKQNGKGNPYEP